MLPNLCDASLLVFAANLASGVGPSAAPSGGGGSGSGGAFLRGGVGHDFSVNAAAVDSVTGGLVLRTGGSVNPTGAYQGGGIGNKAVLSAASLRGQSLSRLASLAVTWQNVTGPAGPFYNPAGAPTVCTPYFNVIVDFNPAGPVHDYRVLVMCADSLNATITNAVGQYANPGGLNTLTYSWTSAQSVLIVLSPPAAAPGGVLPNHSVGPNWPENSYSFAQLVMANPQAIMVEVFPSDGGMPAGAIVGPIFVMAGDSGNTTKSGKFLQSFKVNGSELI